MNRKTMFLTVFSILFLIDQAAFARAGARSSGFGGGSRSSYSSQGSRGSRTYDSQNYNGKNYSSSQKSTTNNNSNNNSNSAANAANINNSKPSFFQQHPMLSIFGSALAGSWLGSMLFGGSGVGGAAGAGGIGSGGGFFSGLMPIILIGLLVWIIIKFIKRNRFNQNLQNNVFDQSSQNSNENYQSSYNENANVWQNSSNNSSSQNIVIDNNEKQNFAEILVAVQSAWSSQDMEKLKRFITPEMFKYFSDALSQNQSQDLQNKVEDIEIMSINISESWQEDNLQYATAIIDWSALDYTINVNRQIGDNLYVSEGDMKNKVTASEAWTFLRYNSGGKWILSAIAQLQ